MRVLLALLLTLACMSSAVAQSGSAELSMRDFLSAPPSVRFAVIGAVRYALQLERLTRPAELGWGALLSRTDFYIDQSLGSKAEELPAAWAVVFTLIEMGCYPAPAVSASEPTGLPEMSQPRLQVPPTPDNPQGASR